ncbi:MAG: hypothetical protein R2799_03640 [Crocinitomicaceae bacterium]
MTYYIHTNCIPVKGDQKGVILDLFRYRYIELSNKAIDLLLQYQGENLDHFKSENEEEVSTHFIQFLENLNDQDYISFNPLTNKKRCIEWNSDIYKKTIDYCEINFSDKINLKLIDQILSPLFISNIFIKTQNPIHFEFILNEINNFHLFEYATYIGLQHNTNLRLSDNMISQIIANNRFSELYINGILENYCSKLDQINIFSSKDCPSNRIKIHVNPEMYNNRINNVQPNKIIINEKNNLSISPMYFTFN